jgi:hypothetical protein
LSRSSLKGKTSNQQTLGPPWNEFDTPGLDDNLLVTQEVGGTLIGEDGLVVMAEAEWVEWYQTHVLNVFDAIPFQPLL